MPGSPKGYTHFTVDGHGREPHRHARPGEGSPISGSLAALARVGGMNGCDTDRANASLQASWHADDPRIGDFCKKFVGCPADYPVIFCETKGFAQSSQEQRMIPAVTRFFDDVESAGQRL